MYMYTIEILERGIYLRGGKSLPSKWDPRVVPCMTLILMDSVINVIVLDCCRLFTITTDR